MQLDKLYTLEEEKRLAAEMLKLYFEDNWTKEQIRVHYGLAHETLKNFCVKYNIKKSPSDYNKKAIDKKFTKEELDVLAEQIRVDFIDNLLLENEIEEKYGLTWTDLQNIKKRYDIVATVEQHWKRTQRANVMKHGVAHMSHIEGSREKANATFKKNYIDNEEGRKQLAEKVKQTNLKKFGTANPNSNLEVQLKAAKTLYGDKFKGEENFYRMRYALYHKEALVEEINKVDEYSRNYRHLSELWQLAEHRIYEAVKEFDLIDMLNKRSYNTSAIEKEICGRIRNIFSNLNVENNVKYIIPPQELDIWIPEIKVAIEINGSYWHSERFVSEEYHQNKSLNCLNLGVGLYHCYEKDLEKDFEQEFNRIVNFINCYVNNSSSCNTACIDIDMSHNNGANLIKEGYVLKNVRKPRVYYQFDNKNVYDAGIATFTREESNQIENFRK